MSDPSRVEAIIRKSNRDNNDAEQTTASRVALMEHAAKIVLDELSTLKQKRDELNTSLALSEQRKAALKCEIELAEQNSEALKLKNQQDCRTFIIAAPRDGDQVVTSFVPQEGQWALNEANIKKIGPNGETILHNYCQFIDSTPAGVFRYLVETKSINVNAVDNNNNTALHNAITAIKANGDLNILTYLFNRKGIDVNIADKDGYRLLHRACRNVTSLSPIIVEYLLGVEKSTDYSVYDKLGNSPLHHLVQQDSELDADIADISQFLIKKEQIQFDKKNNDGVTALELIDKSKKPITYKLFVASRDAKGTKA